MACIEFKKVSFNTYKEAVKDSVLYPMEHSASYTDDGLYIEKYKKENGIWRFYRVSVFGSVIEPVLQKEYDAIQIPKRVTPYSAKYDFYMPFNARIKPHSILPIQTGVSFQTDLNLVLMLFSKNSINENKYISFTYPICVITSDYNQDNEGHILIQLKNPSDEDMWLHAGDVFAQGIFLPYK